MTPRPILLTLLAMAPAAAAAQEPGPDPIPDSIAHPVVSACQARIDPPRWLRIAARDAGLGADEWARLHRIEAALRHANEPLGRRWHELRGERGEPRAAVLAGLRANYLAWWDSARTILGPDRAAALLARPSGIPDDAPGEIRCLGRSIAATLDLPTGTADTPSPDSFRPAAGYWTYDRVASAAGIPVLRRRAIPPGDREVRAWIAGGVGFPRDLYRIVVTNGEISGEVIRYWPATGPGPEAGSEVDIHQEMVDRMAGRCERFARARDVGTCRAVFSAPPDWAAVLAAAEAAGLRTLPDPATLPQPRNPGIQLDGISLTVEVREGAAYRTYHYAFPLSHMLWPFEAERASRILDAFRAVEALLPPR